MSLTFQSPKKIFLKNKKEGYNLVFEDIFETVDFLFVFVNTYFKVIAQGHDIFAQITENNFAKFYFNGEIGHQDYFHDLHDAIEIAQSEIFLAGWCFSPQIFLVRPPKLHPNSRLDQVLLRACRRGVKV